MTDDDIGALINETSTLIKHIELSRYTTVAGFTVLIWDHFITFADEKRLIWPAPLSLVKILFLLNRYSTPLFQAMIVYQLSRLGHFSDNFCKGWLLLIGPAEVISLAISNLLLLLRVHALWARKRGVLAFMLAFYVLTYISVLATATMSVIGLYSTIKFSPVIKVCVAAEKPEAMSAIWAAPLLFEVFIFVMTAIKAVEHARARQINTPLLKSLYLDQLWYFSVIVVLRVFNLIIWVTLPPSYLFLGLYLIWSLVTAFVSRIMLHLRGVRGSGSWSEATSLATKPTIKWAERPDSDDLVDCDDSDNGDFPLEVLRRRRPSTGCRDQWRQHSGGESPNLEGTLELSISHSRSFSSKNAHRQPNRGTGDLHKGHFMDIASRRKIDEEEDIVLDEVATVNCNSVAEYSPWCAAQELPASYELTSQPSGSRRDRTP